MDSQSNNIKSCSSFSEEVSLSEEANSIVMEEETLSLSGGDGGGNIFMFQTN
jgi:hypothetical protein